MKQKINVGLIGLGTVGTGTFRILQENAELIRNRVGVPVEITKIAVRDVKRDRGIAIPAGMLTTNPSHIIDDPDIDIVVVDLICPAASMAWFWRKRRRFKGCP